MAPASAEIGRRQETLSQFANEHTEGNYRPRWALAQMCHFLIHIIVKYDQLRNLTILKALFPFIMKSLEVEMIRNIWRLFFSPNKMVKILSFLPNLLSQNARDRAWPLNSDNLLPGTSIYSPGCELCSNGVGYL